MFWTSNSVFKYKAGGTVRVLNDSAEVRRLQDGHGGWVDAMSAVCLGDQKWAELILKACFQLECRPNWSCFGCG